MNSRVKRQTIDLSQYPDLVVVYLGMRSNSLRGVRTAIALGPQIDKAVAENPDGLLLHEQIIFSLLPPHVGMRQYWRDPESLERWVRTMPHKQWWQKFTRDSGGTGFWHEAYHMRGGIEAIYSDMAVPTGMMKFAPLVEARGPMFGARTRLHGADAVGMAPPVSEDELYGEIGETTG